MKTDIGSRGVVSQQGSDEVTVFNVPFDKKPFNGRWEDLFAEIHEATGQGALTYEQFRDTGFFMRFFRHNQNDKIFMVYQMRHGWSVSEVRPHMHWIPMASGSGDVVFEYNYCWACTFDPIPAATHWITGSVTSSLTPPDQYRHQVVTFGSIAPPSSSAGMGTSAMLFVAVSRPAKDSAADTYTTSKDHGTAAANAAILYFDMHYQRDYAGSIDEY